MALQQKHAGQKLANKCWLRKQDLVKKICNIQLFHVFLPSLFSCLIAGYSFMYYLKFFQAILTRSVSTILSAYSLYVYIGHNFITFKKNDIAEAEGSSLV